ncbi:Ribosome biogenesis protein Nop10 [Candidatus Methanobinarius endosymbioticus]|uniref:Ribosome biogenesis protein Nop10 n=1 Tax=Candidatus Methanobinarius endosymbioticus TaxID=2006182 RepID=A0A366MD97_9EURY|nr:Ribosome biogenesis protein Nop10 [Candidatus Methanobinarius endosymbioticus]
MKMRKCNSCNIYTIKNSCPTCDGETNVVYPPKYSIEDKYGKYRRKLKEETHKL